MEVKKGRNERKVRGNVRVMGRKREIYEKTNSNVKEAKTKWKRKESERRYKSVKWGGERRIEVILILRGR